MKQKSRTDIIIESIMDHIACHQSLAYNPNDLTASTLYKVLRELQSLSLDLIQEVEQAKKEIEFDCLEDLINYLKSIKNIFPGPEATPQAIAVELVRGYRWYKNGAPEAAVDINSKDSKKTVDEFLQQ